MPSVFRTEELSLPSAFCAEGLLCLQFFARQDFPCPRYFAPTDLSAFGFSHDRTFLLWLFAAVQIQCKVMQKVAIRALMNSIVMSEEQRVGLIIKGQPSGEPPFYLMEIPQVNCNQAVLKAK